MTTSKKKPIQPPPEGGRTVRVPNALLERLERQREQMRVDNDGVETPLGKLVERAIAAWLENREAS